jgi:hypothetical protein
MAGQTIKDLAYDAWQQAVKKLDDAKKEYASTATIVEEAINIAKVAGEKEIEAQRDEQRAWLALQFIEIK